MLLGLEAILGDLKGSVNWSLEDCNFGIKPINMIKNKCLKTEEISRLFLKILLMLLELYYMDLRKLSHLKFLLALTESICHVVAKIVVSYPKFHEDCFLLLSKCKDVLIASRNKESLLQVSSTFYNIAGTLYKTHPTFSLKFAESSEMIYKDYLQSNDVGSNQWIHLMKKLDMVASIHLSLHNRVDGIKKWKEIIQSVPVGEWSTFSEDSTNSALLKTIQRYIKAVTSNYDQDHAYVIDLINIDSCRKQSIYHILDFELKTLVILHQTINTAELQIGILHRMLEFEFDPESNLRYASNL